MTKKIGKQKSKRGLPFGKNSQIIPKFFYEGVPKRTEMAGLVEKRRKKMFLTDKNRQISFFILEFIN